MPPLTVAVQDRVLVLYPRCLCCGSQRTFRFVPTPVHRHSFASRSTLCPKEPGLQSAAVVTGAGVECPRRRRWPQRPDLQPVVWPVPSSAAGPLRAVRQQRGLCASADRAGGPHRHPGEPAASRQLHHPRGGPQRRLGREPAVGPAVCRGQRLHQPCRYGCGVAHMDRAWCFAPIAPRGLLLVLSCSGTSALGCRGLLCSQVGGFVAGRTWSLGVVWSLSSGSTCLCHGSAPFLLGLSR